MSSCAGHGVRQASRDDRMNHPGDAECFYAGNESSVRGRALAAQVGQHRQNTAVIGLALGQPELAEDALHVLLHRPAGDE